ncbi:DEKNAAC100684 [Brettanomyces naardenensis]|uniref:DEKNAAC100684 n=1 Tax=Brettanomyces naardenensis TaxID=13370 RepID=A0A448YES6_BRENA|nr:DEKNAAC100684 [Brettanomyces naardenensis]
MSTSRYTSKVHQREGRMALFATTPGTTTPNGYSVNPSVNGKDPSTQIDPNDIARSSSPYEAEPRRDYNAAMLSQLESQNEETVNTMQSKISALKDLSLKMGDQINQSKLNLGSLGSNMEAAGHRIRGNMKRMFVMAEKTGISWKTWLLFFAIVFLIFFWVWLF